MTSISISGNSNDTNLVLASNSARITENSPEPTVVTETIQVDRLMPSVELKLATSFTSPVMNALFNWTSFVNDLSNNCNIHLTTIYPTDASDPELAALGFSDFKNDTANGITAGHPYTNLQKVFDGEVHMALADSNYWVTAYDLSLTSTPIPKSVGLWSNPVPFGMTSNYFYSWLDLCGNDLFDAQGSTLGNGIKILSGGNSAIQPAGYIASSRNNTGYNLDASFVAEFKQDPISWYKNKKLRIGGFSGAILNALGANCAAYPPRGFFNLLNSVQDSSDTYFQGGEFINPGVDNAFFQVISQHKACAYIKNSWGECAPGVNIVIDKTTWDNLTLTQRNNFEALFLAKRAEVEKIFLNFYFNGLDQVNAAVSASTPSEISNNYFEIIDLDSYSVNYSDVSDVVVGISSESTLPIYHVFKNIWEQIDVAGGSLTTLKVPNDPYWNTIRTSYKNYQNKVYNLINSSEYQSSLNHNV